MDEENSTYNCDKLPKSDKFYPAAMHESNAKVHCGNSNNILQQTSHFTASEQVCWLIRDSSESSKVTTVMIMRKNESFEHEAKRKSI